MSIQSELDKARQHLLDLSLRNRLLNTPFGRSRARNIEVTHRDSEDIFDLLVKQEKNLSFAPLTEEE